MTTFTFFCGHNNENGELSNWYPCTFTALDHSFSSVEQYMMYCKAQLFGDNESAEKILKSNDPKCIKAIGRQVKNWNQELWDQHKISIVTEGLRCKFSQNNDLCKVLLNTGDSIIVEAAHYDKIWGNGLRATHKDATTPEKWPGQNLLGQCLMTVRNELLSST